MQKEGLRRKELVKVLNRLEIISNPLNTMEVAKSTTHAHSSIPHPLKKKYLYIKEIKQKDAPDIGVPQLWSNLGA